MTHTNECVTSHIQMTHTNEFVTSHMTHTNECVTLLGASGLPHYCTSICNRSCCSRCASCVNLINQKKYIYIYIYIYKTKNLRYIQSETDTKKMQASLNLSLDRVLHVYGDHTPLLVDTGIPPLQLTYVINVGSTFLTWDRHFSHFSRGASVSLSVFQICLSLLKKGRVLGSPENM